MKLTKNDKFTVLGGNTFAGEELIKYLEKAGLCHSDSGDVTFELCFDDTLGSEGMKIEISDDKITILGNGKTYGCLRRITLMIQSNHFSDVFSSLM